VPARRGKLAKLTAAGLAASVLLASAALAAVHWMAVPGAPDLGWLGQADALGMQLASALGAQAGRRTEVVSVGFASASGYRNPLRNIRGLVPERIDMGVDFTGSGPVYALGAGVVVRAASYFPGWPGGGWVTYRLTDGPDAGLVVYVAEDVTPSVTAGQHVSSSTVIATMYDGGDGIETGWAQPAGQAAESQLPQAGGISGGGPFPTRVGVDFEELLQSLGVPAAPNRTQPAYGLLPENYLAKDG
jgi:murein DD-endopeptidase MepM/ murein hydrolase activator NlpD